MWLGFIISENEFMYLFFFMRLSLIIAHDSSILAYKIGYKPDALEYSLI